MLHFRATCANYSIFRHHLDVLVSRKPLLQRSSVTLLVPSPAPNSILGRLQRTVKAARVLVFKELLNLVKNGNVSKRFQTQANETVDDNGVSELGGDKIPVVLHKVPLDGTASRVSGQVATEHVHVGRGDGVLGRRRVKVEGDEVVLDEIGIFHSGKAAEDNELAVDGLCVEPLLLEDFDVASGVVSKTGAPDDASQRRVDGVGLGVLNPSVESLDTFRFDPVLMVSDHVKSREQKKKREKKDSLTRGGRQKERSEGAPCAEYRQGNPRPRETPIQPP